MADASAKSASELSEGTTGRFARKEEAAADVGHSAASYDAMSVQASVTHLYHAT